MLGFKRAGGFSLLAACALLGGFAVSSQAQQAFGSIYGTVTDPSGAPVANAKVTVTDTAKGTTFGVTTNASGIYTKGQLIPDPYTVAIQAPGFQRTVSNQLTVDVDHATQFNVTLQVGSVQQQVEVTAAVPLLQTTSADVSQTFTAQQVAQLPSIGRNLQSFELLNPGTVKFGWQHASDENPQGSVQSEVNGQLFDSTGYFLDGTVDQDPILGIIVINPTFDSVNEIKQNNQSYDAQYGYTGAGLMIYSTKSGSNTFHGDAFDYIYLNTPGFQDFGRDPFANNVALSPGVYTPTTHQNQFGGSISGRVIKNKLFFFGDAQLTRNHTGGSALTGVPTAQDRVGNLGDWLPLGTPVTINGTSYQSTQIFDPTTGDPATGTGRVPFAGNSIPTTRLSPQALNLINSYFPAPNTAQSGVGVPYNNYSGSGVIINDGNQWNTRWDYYPSEKDTIFGRYSYVKYNLGGPGVFGLVGGGPGLTGLSSSGSSLRYAGQSNSRDDSVAFGWTHTFSPTLINDFHFGFLRYFVFDVPNGYGTQPATAAGIPGMNLDNTYTSGLPYFEIDNPNQNYYLGYGLGTNGCNCPLTQDEKQYQFVDDISKVAGNHTLKFGADIRYAINLRVPSDSHRAGQVFFNNSITGYYPSDGASPVGGLGIASFLLGDPSSFDRYVSSSTDAMEHQKRWFFYGQDEWHATPKLTVTYGMRWVLVFPETVNAPGNGAELNINTGLMDVFGVGLISNHGYQAANYRDFAPRLSVAYQVTPKTVVRAGYGWTYSLGTFGSTFGHNVTQNVPVLAHQNITQQTACGNNFCDVFTLGPSGNGLSVGPTPYNPGPLQPGPDGTFPLPGTGPNAVESKTRPGVFTMPTIYLYNFTVQHQLTSKISIQGAYVGNSGRHMLLGTDENWDMNQPYFIPGVPKGSPQLLPFDGLLGPRYNYGWTQPIDNYCNCSNNRYDSFQGIVNIRALGGYTVTGNYTYQRAQGDGWGGNESYTFLYDRPLGYGQNPNMPHQQITVSQNFDIPFGRGRRWGNHVNRFVDLALGGWNVSGITTWYSGLPFRPTIGSYAGQPYNGPSDRPDVGSGSPYAPNKNRNQWILGIASGAYAIPAPNTFGNWPINNLYGPQFIDQDMSLMKQFSLTERLKFTLRADARNVFNHTNLGMPDSGIQDSNVGQITGLGYGGGNMRLLQYSGTINW